MLSIFQSDINDIDLQVTKWQAQIAAAQERRDLLSQTEFMVDGAVQGLQAALEEVTRKAPDAITPLKVGIKLAVADLLGGDNDSRSDGDGNQPLDPFDPDPADGNSNQPQSEQTSEFRYPTVEERAAIHEALGKETEEEAKGEDAEQANTAAVDSNLNHAFSEEDAVPADSYAAIAPNPFPDDKLATTFRVEVENRGIKLEVIELADSNTGEPIIDIPSVEVKDDARQDTQAPTSNDDRLFKLVKLTPQIGYIHRTDTDEIICCYVGFTNKAKAKRWGEWLSINHTVASRYILRPSKRLTNFTYELKLWGVCKQHLEALANTDLSKSPPSNFGPAPKPVFFKTLPARLQIKPGDIVTSGIVPDWKYRVLEINDELQTFKGEAVNPTGNQPSVLEMSLMNVNLLVENRFAVSQDIQVEIDSCQGETSVDNESNDERLLTPEERSKQLTRDVERGFAADILLIDETDVPVGVELKKVANTQEIKFDVWVWAFLDERGVREPKQKRIGQLIQVSDIKINAHDMNGASNWFKRTLFAVNWLLKRVDLEAGCIQQAFSLWQQQQKSQVTQLPAIASQETKQKSTQKLSTTDVVINETDVPIGVHLERTEDWVSIEYRVWAYLNVRVKGILTVEQRCLGRIVQTSSHIVPYSPKGRACGYCRRTLNAILLLIEVAGYSPEAIKEAFAMWQENQAAKDSQHLIEDHGDFIDNGEEDLRLASDYEAEQQPEDDTNLTEEDLQSIQSWITLDELDQMR